MRWDDVVPLLIIAYENTFGICVYIFTVLLHIIKKLYESQNNTMHHVCNLS
jgi:hypothetical protein